jgi:hypothetical protein
MIHVVDPRQNRLFDPFEGVIFASSSVATEAIDPGSANGMKSTRIIQTLRRIAERQLSPRIEAAAVIRVSVSYPAPFPFPFPPAIFRR